MSCHSDFSHLLFFLHLPTLFVYVRDQTDIVSLNSIKKSYWTNELQSNYHTISPSLMLTSFCEYFPRSYFDPPKFASFLLTVTSRIFTLCVAKSSSVPIWGNPPFWHTGGFFNIGNVRIPKAPCLTSPTLVVSIHYQTKVGGYWMGWLLAEQTQVGSWKAFRTIIIILIQNTAVMVKV